MLDRKKYTIINVKSAFDAMLNTGIADFTRTHSLPHLYAGTIFGFCLDFEPKDFREKFSKPVYLSKNSKIFIQDDCSVPRSKLKSAIDIKTTTDYKKADWLVVSENPLYKNCSVLHYVGLLKQENIPDVIEKIKRKINNIQHVYPPIFDVDELNEYLLILESVKNDVLFLYHSRNKINELLSSETIETVKLHYNPTDYLSHIIDNQDKVIHESVIINMLNNDIVMDETLYNSLSKMLESGDPSNITLAMETMANCNYEKSMVYVLMLIERYGYHIRYSPAIKHVNFKSLMKYYGFTNYDLERQDVDKIVTFLKSKDLLTSENISIIAKFAKEKIHEILRPRMHSFYVSDIQFDENFIKE